MKRDRQPSGRDRARRSAGLQLRLRALLLPAAFALALTQAPLQARAQPLEVRVAGQEALMPKWVHLRKGMAGICPDMMMAVERVEPRLHFVGHRQSRSLTGIEVGLENGALDVACALVSSTRRLAIGRPAGPPVYVVRHRLAARAGDAADIHSVQDLMRMDALVVAQRGAVFTEELRASGIRVDDATDDNGLNLRKMLAGHGRFVDMNELTLRHYLRDPALAQRVRILPAVLKEESAYFWVSNKADPAIARLLGPALEKLRTSGELERIYRMHAANP